MARALFSLTVFVQCAAFSQSGVTLVAAGYSDPTAPTIAPGQYLTFYLSGVRTILSGELQAHGTPLPMTLGGFSARIRQTARNDSFQVAVFRSAAKLAPADSAGFE